MPPKPRPPGPRPRTDRSSHFDSQLMIVLGAGLLVGIVAVVLSLTLGHSSSNTPTDVSADLSSESGIPQHALVLGNPKAKVTLTEYIDMTCPICREYTLTTLPSIVKRYVRPGKVKIEMRPVNNGWPSGGRGRELVLAAAQQNKAWPFAEVSYHNQGSEQTAWLTDDLARAIAATVPGLNVETLFAAAKSTAVRTEAAVLDAEAQSDGVTGTPTFFLTTQDGKRHLLGAGNPSLAGLQRVLDSALKA